MELKGKERQFFKKEAHSLKPIFQIGKGGLSEEMIQSNSKRC
jgi:RNA-binding protein yqeI